MAIAGVVLAAVGLAMVPPDATLGGDIRAVFFHGAVTWTGIVMAACGGLAGLGILVLGWDIPTRVWRLLSSGHSLLGPLSHLELPRDAHDLGRGPLE